MTGFLRIAGFSCALCALLLTSTAPAATWNVPGDAATIAAGLAAASSGDTVLVACGTWLEHDLVLPSGVTLRSANGNPACVVIDAQDLGRCLDVVKKTGVRIEGLTLRNGVANTGVYFDNAGGGIRCDSSAVTIASCLVTECHSVYGAGLASRASNLTIDATVFDADSASSPQWSAGGGMYAKVSTGAITNCTFSHNASYANTYPGDGGGVFLETCTFLMTDCLFDRNGSGVGAAALYSFLHDHSQFVRCTFTNNAAPAGGAAYVEAAEPLFDECTFSGNTGWNGGAIFVGPYQGARSQPVIEDCLFENNHSTPYGGGGIEVWNSTPSVTRCTFRGNTTNTRGGAITARGTTSLELMDCLLEGNSALTDGGAVWSGEQAVTRITRCTIRANSTGSGGGSISSKDLASVQVSRSILAFASLGPAAICGGTATISIGCSDIFGNAGGNWIGCIAGQQGVAQNFSLDPFFCPSVTDGSVRFPDSPCLAANSPCGNQVGVATAGCGCPPGATILVPSDYPTIATALAAASPGDVVGLCAGEWVGSVDVPSGVHLVGVSRELVRVVADSMSPGLAVLRAVNVADSTVIADLTLDGLGIVPQVVLAESGSTGLHLVRNVITGGESWGVVNDSDSRVRIGGSVACANDVYGNGGATPRSVRNDNVVADSLDATFNWWGSETYLTILSTIQGRVRICPITNSAHDSTGACFATAAPLPLVQEAAALVVVPNPTRGQTRISFAALPGRVTTVQVYDILGRSVRMLLSGPLVESRGELWWNGRDDRDHVVAPGVYFVRLESGKSIATRKIVLVR